MVNEWSGSAKNLTPEQLQKRKSINKKIFKFFFLPIILLVIIIVISTNSNEDKNQKGLKTVNMDSVCESIKKDSLYNVTDVFYNQADSSLNIAIEYKKDDIVFANNFYAEYHLNTFDNIEGVYVYKKGTQLKNADKTKSLNYVSRKLAERIKKFEDSGFEYNIKSYLEKNVNDPTGLEILRKWIIRENEDGTFAVKVSFRAKNAFGTLMIHTLNCDMDMEGNGKNIEFDK
ncbi:MAG: hypothetical protein J0I09_00010 [Sphingobacteriia bacterium]|nr:hypothetical protein [Sphingobacteriia bacterium]